ncbi:MAG TPA: type II secretion system major pseudopilin GspG [Stellaceae bacterium]|jgi:general secretion pathway protein G|nr:type II secretion system major pseudopilin GspG [Stellaceae bacterium]
MTTGMSLRSDLRTNRREAGFTLLELLVVLAILGMLIGLVAPAVLHQLSGAKDKIARQSIQRLAGVLDLYELDVGTYPDTDQGLKALVDKPADIANWNGPYLKGRGLPEDPWGHPFQYRQPSDRPGHPYDLYSLGPDGKGQSEKIMNE